MNLQHNTPLSPVFHIHDLDFFCCYMFLVKSSIAQLIK